MNRRTEWRVNADSPVTDLVTESLDHDGSIVGQRTSGFDLLVDVLQQVACSKRVEAMLRGERALCCSRRLLVANGPQERPHCTTEFQRSAESIAVPKRHLARLPRGRVHDHSIERHVFDAPGGGSEHERFARSGFVHHLLIEFAYSRAIGQEHTEHSPIRNGATVGDCEPLRSVTSPKCVGDAIPHDARFQVAELLTWIATCQQIEHVVAHLVGQLREVCATTNHRGERLHAAVGMHRYMRHYVLCQHVQRITQVPRGFDFGTHHSLCDNRNLEQVVPMLGEHLSTTRLTNAVSSSTDALQTSAYRAG